MKPGNLLRALSIGVACLCLPMAAGASTVWTGPLITYNQPAPDPTQPANQDQLTPNVALTRAAATAGSGMGGMFNAVSESSFSKGVSPADTEWAVGTLDNYASLSYTDWTTCGGGRPVQNYPGEQLVVHLKTDDIYLSLKFTSLPQGSGFTYIRSTPAVADQPPSVTITNPASGTNFSTFPPATNVFVSLAASASDSDGSVTNVQFFDGTNRLGNVTAAPYQMTASFGLGSHALTAVATDNAGLSSTSGVVNISVNVGNTPLRLTVQPANGALDISWPVTGARLQTQTNSRAVGLATNWITVAGSTATNHVVVPQNPTNGGVFFRLAVP